LVNYYRKHSERTLSPEEADLLEATEMTVETTRPDIEGLLSGLSEKERTIMLMKYREGLRVKEIAQKTQKTENAVKLILSRTRKKLQRQHAI
jgi:RNA polymerase sigma-70 factor (ECF subfamily)